MPRTAEILSEEAVSAITKPGFHAVGGVDGLLLQVTKTGGRSWVLRVMKDGRRRGIGLGGAKDVSLQQARRAAELARRQLAEGKDPIKERVKPWDRKKRAVEGDPELITYRIIDLIQPAIREAVARALQEEGLI